MGVIHATVTIVIGFLVLLAIISPSDYFDRMKGVSQMSAPLITVEDLEATMYLPRTGRAHVLLRIKNLWFALDSEAAQYIRTNILRVENAIAHMESIETDRPESTIESSITKH